jgi:hypothetical protein
MVLVLAQQAIGRKLEIAERADAGEILAGFRRQCQRPVLPDEQANPKLLLQPFDWMADRGLRDVQLEAACGSSNARRGPEGACPFSEGSLPVISPTPRLHDLSCETVQSVVCGRPR